MTPDGSPVRHQTLHRSPRRIRRYYFRCACGFLRGRNSRFRCPLCLQLPPSAMKDYRMPALLSAELKNGQYVKPVVELEPEQLWVGFREVWTASHGRAARYHVMVDGGAAACRPGLRRQTRHTLILLNEDTLLPIGDTPAHMCCLRSGCRQLFSAALGHRL